MASTLYTPQYNGLAQSPGIGLFGDLKSMSATYAFTTTANTVNDIIYLRYLPKNSILVEAYAEFDPIDSNGSRTADITVGWLAAGLSTDTYTAPDGVVYTNAFSSTSAAGIGDTGVLTAALNQYNFPLTSPLFASAKTLLTATIKAVQATAAAGNARFVFRYVLI